MVNDICQDIGSINELHEPLNNIMFKGSDPTIKMVLASDLRKNKSKGEKAERCKRAGKEQGQGRSRYRLAQRTPTLPHSQEKVALAFDTYRQGASKPLVPIASTSRA